MPYRYSKALLPIATFALGALLALSLAGDAKSSKKQRLVTPKGDIARLASPNGAATIDILAQGKNAFFGVLRMKAGGAVPKHRDATEEFIYVLEGSGTITIDGADFPVKPGTSIYMPAKAEVAFRGGSQPLVAVQVFAGPAPAAKYGAWKATSKGK